MFIFEGIIIIITHYVLLLCNCIGERYRSLPSLRSSAAVLLGRETLAHIDWKGTGTRQLIAHGNRLNERARFIQIEIVFLML